MLEFRQSSIMPRMRLAWRQRSRLLALTVYLAAAWLLLLVGLHAGERHFFRRRREEVFG